MKTAIVTGAGGFVGGALTEFLLNQGVKVYGVDISAKAMERHENRDGFIPVVADFKKYGQLHEIIQDDVDAFFHFAWQGVFGDAFKDYRQQLSNAASAGDAITEAIKIGCKKFVFAGSMNEYEMDNYIKLDYFEPRYTYIYSTAKQAAEAVCKTIANGLGNGVIEYSCGRIAMAYGEGNRSMMVPNVVMKNLLLNTPCKLIEGKNKYDMVYVDDIVGAFYAIGECGAHMKSYYIGHRKIVTFREIIENIANILNPDCPLLFGAYPDSPSGVDYKNIDTEALYRDTGFECKTDYKESIVKTAEWIKHNL